MKTRALGIFLMTAGACAFGCSSSNGGGTGGQTADAGTGGRGGTAGTGTGGTAGTGAGGTAGTGAGGSAGAGAGGRVDGGTDATGDALGDALQAATFTEVFAILSNTLTPTADTSPGCANCHDGILPDGGMFLPHGINFRDKATAYSQLVGIDSLRCGAVDGGTALKRIQAGSPTTSVLVQKVSQGLGLGTACDGVAMPINRPNTDGGSDAAGFDAGFQTHYSVTLLQLQTIASWVQGGALNN